MITKLRNQNKDMTDTVSFHGVIFLYDAFRTLSVNIVVDLDFLIYQHYKY